MNFLKISRNCWRKKHLLKNSVIFYSGECSVLLKFRRWSLCLREITKFTKEFCLGESRLKLCTDLGVYAEYFRYSNLVFSVLFYCCADNLSFSRAFFLPCHLMWYVWWWVGSGPPTSAGGFMKADTVMQWLKYASKHIIQRNPTCKCSHIISFITWHLYVVALKRGVIIWFTCLLPVCEPGFTMSPRIWALRMMEDSASMHVHWNVW